MKRTTDLVGFVFLSLQYEISYLTLMQLQVTYLTNTKQCKKNLEKNDWAPGT